MSERDCSEAAASRVRTVPGAVIKDSRSKEAAVSMGSPNNAPVWRIEVDIVSSSLNVTYVFICTPNPGHEPDLDLIGIH
jgi:hypothetical protein